MVVATSLIISILVSQFLAALHGPADEQHRLHHQGIRPHIHLAGSEHHHHHHGHHHDHDEGLFDHDDDRTPLNRRSEVNALASSEVRISFLNQNRLPNSSSLSCLFHHDEDILFLIDTSSNSRKESDDLSLEVSSLFEFVIAPRSESNVTRDYRIRFGYSPAAGNEPCPRYLLLQSLRC